MPRGLEHAIDTGGGFKPRHSGPAPTSPPPKPSDAKRAAVPPSQSIFPMPEMDETLSEGLREYERHPAQPPSTPGLGRPETTRKEARWERAITWLLSRGEG